MFSSSAQITGGLWYRWMGLMVRTWTAIGLLNFKLSLKFLCLEFEWRLHFYSNYNCEIENLRNFFNTRAISGNFARLRKWKETFSFQPYSGKKYKILFYCGCPAVNVFLCFGIRKKNQEIDYLQKLSLIYQFKKFFLVRVHCRVS
jgi:hypothetical protein